VPLGRGSGSGPGADAPFYFPTNPDGFPAIRSEGINMPVLVACPSCGRRLKIPSKLARSGRPINCPHCKVAFDLGKEDDGSDFNAQRLRSLTVTLKIGKAAFTTGVCLLILAVALAFAVSSMLELNATLDNRPKEYLIGQPLYELLCFGVGGWVLFLVCRFLVGSPPIRYSALVCGIGSIAIAPFIHAKGAIPLTSLFWGAIIGLCFLHRWMEVVQRRIESIQQEEKQKREAIEAEEATRQLAKMNRRSQQCPACQQLGAREILNCEVLDKTLGQRLQEWWDRIPTPQGWINTKRQQYVTIELRKYRVHFQCRYCNHQWTAETRFRPNLPTNEEAY
jgi:hypothetical protein